MPRARMGKPRISLSGVRGGANLQAVPSSGWTHALVAGASSPGAEVSVACSGHSVGVPGARGWCQGGAAPALQ